MSHSNSFFAAIGNTAVDQKRIAVNLNWGQTNNRNYPNLAILFNECSFFDLGKLHLHVFGKVFNSGIIHENFTADKLPLLKGNFVALLIDHQNNTVSLYSAISGNIPAYIIETNDAVYLTSQLRAFRKTELFQRRLIPLDTYHYSYTDSFPQNFSLMQNCERVIPGMLYTFSIGQKSKMTGRSALKEIRSQHLAIDKIEAKEKLYGLLQKNITENIQAGEKVAVPLSGGVDSGTIAGMLSKNGHETYTFSIGTEFGNEYEKAKLSAEFCHSNHTEIFISDNEYLEGLLYSTFYNEICDPLYAEGFPAFYEAAKQASKITSKLFTGYGADLVLGNMFKAEDENAINTKNASWCRRTSWTGELSPYVPGIFGCEMFYPYWSEELLDFALSLPAGLLQNATHEKIILRELSEEKKLAHPDIAWNKKTALTHGTSLDKVFAKLLKLKNPADYLSKSRFLYYLFEAFFVSDQEISEVDIEAILKKSKEYDLTH